MIINGIHCGQLYDMAYKQVTGGGYSANPIEISRINDYSVYIRKKSTSSDGSCG